MSIKRKVSDQNPSGSKNKREQKMLEKKDRIIRAAIQVFAAKGYPQGTIADISQRAKVSYGLAYTYFKNKEDILLSIFSERWQRFIEYLEKVKREAAPASMKLEKVGNFLVRSYEREPDLMKVMVMNVVPNSFFYKKNKKAVEKAFRLIQAIVEEGQEEGVIDRSLDSQIVTHGLHGGVLQILVGWIQGFIPVSPSSVAGAYYFIKSTAASLPGNGEIKNLPSVKVRRADIESCNHF